MEETGKIRKNFIGYEYKEVICERQKIPFLLDGYENFGWEPTGELQENGLNPHQTKMTLQLRRDRKMVNKMELTRLQRNFEDCVGQIDALEKSKTSRATICALSVALVGTAFMAGSVFAVTAQPPLIILSILLAVPGFLGWILPYFVYRKVKETQSSRLTPLIEEKYDEIYELCQKGNKLLY